MWNVFPKSAQFKIVLVLFSAILLLTLIMLFNDIDSKIGPDFSSYIYIFNRISPVSILFILLIFIIGKIGWKILWKAPYLGDILNSNVCPDLNGEWVGNAHSNYIGNDGKKTIKQVEMKIKADFFGFSISLKSDDEYQYSKVIQCGINKDLRTGSFYLTYVYEGFVPKPSETDDRLFEGAAKLEVCFNEGRLKLEGTYWTNRALQRNLNATGFLKLHRKNDYL